MKHVTFRGSVIEVDSIEIPKFTYEAIRNEEAIYGGSCDWVMQYAGPITQEITQRIMDAPSFEADILHHSLLGYHPVIDTRVTMLMNSKFRPGDPAEEEFGMFQSIPGWHCDGVIRKDRQSQPDLDTVNDPVCHYLVTLSTTPEAIAPTQFIVGDYEMDIDENQPIWWQVDKHIREHPEGLPLLNCEDNKVYHFNRAALHRATPAIARGFRYFYRMSFHHMPVKNEFRRTSNVYVTLGGGW